MRRGCWRRPSTSDGAQAIARRARGTPRVALRLLRRLRDYAQVRAQGRITEPVADEALALLEIDELGLDDLDRRVLDALINKFSGGPVGLDTLAASISEEADTIMDVVEPYLLQLGLSGSHPAWPCADAGGVCPYAGDLSGDGPSRAGCLDRGAYGHIESLRRLAVCTALAAGDCIAAGSSDSPTVSIISHDSPRRDQRRDDAAQSVQVGHVGRKPLHHSQLILDHRP